MEITEIEKQLEGATRCKPGDHDFIPIEILLNNHIPAMLAHLREQRAELAKLGCGDGFICGAVAGKGIFDGGCGEHVYFSESYRCADCTASFHRDCIVKHFHSHGQTCAREYVQTITEQWAALRQIVEHLKWQQSHSAESVKRVTDNSPLNGYFQGQHDCAESTLAFIEKELPAVKAAMEGK